MKRGHPVRLLACCLAGLAVALPAAEPGGWHDDFDAAVEQAAASGKEHLVVFTGLAWEPWSRRLRDEALGHPEFLGAVRGDFVLTHIDLPETPRDEESLTAAEARGYRLAREFKIRVFPAIYLCTTEGRPYALAGYAEGGPGALAAAIREKRTAYAAAMLAISRHEGPARARAIDGWLESIPEPLRHLHRDKIEAVIASDPHDRTGLRSKHQLALMLPEARALRYAGNLDEAEARYRRIVAEAEPKGEALQRVYYELADVHFQRRDYDGLLDTLDLAIAAAPRGERMAVLREMMEAFTRQWIFMKCKPAEMQAAGYDHRRVELGPGDAGALRKAIAEAKRTAPASTRNRTLDAMAAELGGTDEGR